MVKSKDASPRTKYSEVQNEIKSPEKWINGESTGFMGSQLL